MKESKILKEAIQEEIKNNMIKEPILMLVTLHKREIEKTGLRILLKINNIFELKQNERR